MVSDVAVHLGVCEGECGAEAFCVLALCAQATRNKNAAACIAIWLRIDGAFFMVTPGWYGDNDNLIQ